jgi:hypothetical protein
MPGLSLTHIGGPTVLIAFAVSLPGRSALLVETSIKEGSK